MIYISHRGNLNGPNPEKENHPDYLKEAVKKGFQVELDVWFENDKFYLGHDEAQYEIKKQFLSNNNFWCHAKNMEAIGALTSSGNFIHCFFHHNDACTLTSRGWIWTYPGELIVSKKSIAVLPESLYAKTNENSLKTAGGICSDYIINYKNSLT